MFRVGNGDIGAECGVPSWLCSKDTRTTQLASCWWLYCRLWGQLAPCPGFSLVDFGKVNAVWVLVIFMTRFALPDNIFGWFFYFAVIFCSIRLLLFTVNITNFNDYLTYIMKLQVLVVLWSVLKSPLVLGLRFAATSQFICVVG